MIRIQNAIDESIDVKRQISEDKDLQEKINLASQKCISALREGNRILLAGNGGSAADAQHIAAELVSRFYYDRPGLPAIALTTDTSMLTAIGNDYGYEKLFSRQLQANGRSGDVFIGISTSGNSANVINALETAKETGVFSIGLGGASGKIVSASDLCISIPSTCTPRIQEAHIMIGHIICELIEATIFPR